jgi:hypothetical protein
MVDPPGPLAEGTSADTMAAGADADVIGPLLHERQGRDSAGFQERAVGAGAPG